MPVHIEIVIDPCRPCADLRCPCVFMLVSMCRTLPQSSDFVDQVYARNRESCQSEYSWNSNFTSLAVLIACRISCQQKCVFMFGGPFSNAKICIHVPRAHVRNDLEAVSKYLSFVVDYVFF